jgi:hypothetical protein
MLLTGLEMSFVDHYLPYFRQLLITCPLSALLLFQSLFTESSCGDQLLAPSHFSVLRAPTPLCCVFFFSSLFIIQFFLFYFCGAGSVRPGGHADLSQVWLWEYLMMLICPPVRVLKVSQAGLEPAYGSTEALLSSQCNAA